MKPQPPSKRFSSDALSWPLWARVVGTLPFVAVTFVLGGSLLMAAGAGTPSAVILLFLFSSFLMLAVPVVRAIWRPSEAWRRDQVSAHLLQRRLQEEVSKGEADHLPE